MRQQIITQIGVGASGVVVFDWLRNPFNVSIGAVLVSGSATYTIQHTFDWDYAAMGIPAGATWFAHDDAALVNATGNAESNFAYPCVASRINQTVGTGTVTVTFTQAGLMGG